MSATSEAAKPRAIVRGSKLRTRSPMHTVGAVTCEVDERVTEPDTHNVRTLIVPPAQPPPSLCNDSRWRYNYIDINRERTGTGHTDWNGWSDKTGGIFLWIETICELPEQIEKRRKE